ncbi:MAG TPA: metallophosphoesterase [Armatimonadota bacterium]|nr:metallophosphoesterase [Armatimonadota bacterium]
MRVIAVGDMHGELKYVFRAVEDARPDLLLCCGDWGDPAEMDPGALDAILAAAPVFTVYGNHDDLGLLSQVRNLDGDPVLLSAGEIRERDGLRFAGISGIWAKSHRQPHYVTDEDVATFASGLAGRGVDVLLSHGCPIGLADATPSGTRGGQRCFLDAFHVISPRLHLCGHLHVPQKRVLKDGRIIVNVGYTCEGDYWSFEINQEAIEVEYHKL